MHTDVRFALGAVLGYIDVSVVHPTASSRRRSASHRPLAAARTRERAKDRKYLARATAENAIFVPFIVETYGGWGVKAQAFCKRLANFAEDHAARWTAIDVREALRKGVSEQLQLRNLRLLDDQLSLCHAAPPFYLGSQRPARRRRRRSGTPPSLSPSGPRDPPGPPGPPAPSSRQRRAQQRSSRSQLPARRRVSAGTVLVHAQSGRRTLEECLQIRPQLRATAPSLARPAPPPAPESTNSMPVETNQAASQPTLQPTVSSLQEGVSLSEQATPTTLPPQVQSDTSPPTSSETLRSSRPPDANSSD